ncbi:MAG: hypothetical protein QOE05_3733, partial [Actinomycetota bacterium]|nr:hypothetical protein [Actinomycetota bacterium]
MFVARRRYRLVAAASTAFLLLPVAGVIASHSAAQAQPAKKPAAIPHAFADFYAPTPYSQLLKQPDGSTVAAKLTPAEIGGA